MQVRLIRNTPELPFGGIQLIFAGDFFQLAAIDYKKVSLRTSDQFLQHDNTDDTSMAARGLLGGNQLPIAFKEFSAPAFRSNVWREARFTYVKLDTMSATLVPPPLSHHSSIQHIIPHSCARNLFSPSSDMMQKLQFPAERFELHQLPGHAAAGRSANAGNSHPQHASSQPSRFKSRAVVPFCRCTTCSLKSLRVSYRTATACSPLFSRPKSKK